jgi:NADPH:quinone reductase-like Zn-dependent oxidoreductase
MDTYPNILGQDAAGEIVEIGEGVTRYKKGDRVMMYILIPSKLLSPVLTRLISHCLGLVTKKPQHSAFQNYVLGFDSTSSPIPESLSYEHAVALPLAISTASLGLHGKSFLGLPHPTKDVKPSNKAILVYGASSAVGYVAVQLAVASGVDVVATASPRNFDLVKTAGAKHVVDYRSDTLVEDATAQLKQYGKFAGVFDAISEPDTIKTCAKIADSLGGGAIACTLDVPEGLPSSVEAAMCKSWRHLIYPMVFLFERS